MENDILVRLRADPGRRTLGELLQEREAYPQHLSGGKMKQLMFIAISISCLSLSGCGGGGSGQAQAATPTTVVLDVTLEQFTASDTDGVQSVSCPPDASAISASCFCDIGNGAGPIFALEVDGNGAVCGCDFGTGPLTTLDVTVTCSSLIFGTVLSGAAGGIEVQPLPPSQPDANKVNEWAEKIKTKEAELMKARAARAR